MPEFGATPTPNPSTQGGGGNGFIHVATIVAAHGIRGEVKVKSFTTDPRAFTSYGPLQNAGGFVFEITKVRPQKDEFLCTLRNILDRNAAEALRGTELFVARDKLPAPAPGEIYLSDVQGKEVVTGDQKLGRITGFQNFGAGELMELEGGMLIPVSFIVAVDAAVSIALPEGYLDPES